MGTQPFLLLVLLSSPSVAQLGSVLVGTFANFPYSTWPEAQASCRSSGSDLATFRLQSDVDRFSALPLFVWVGLRTTSLNQWTWISGEPLDTSRSAVLGTPLLGTACAYYNYLDRHFYSSSCDSSYFFLCYKLDGKMRELTLVNQSKSWADAQQFCRSGFSDLAVSDNVTQLAAAGQQDFPVWIGLRRYGEAWSWSEGVSDYRSWAPGEPGDGGDCVAISSVSKTMTTQNCAAWFPFACYRDNLLLVKQNKTWEEALEHCRAFRSPSGGPYQLVSLQPGDLSYMMARATEADTEEVWTGLRFLAGDWFWVNGAGLLLPELPLCPVGGRHCGALSRRDGVEPRDCLEAKNFLCYNLW